MKLQKISSFVAALAASVTIQASAATLEQALTFDLSGNSAGTALTNHNVKLVPNVGVRITTKDIIALLTVADTSDLRQAQLLILSQFGPGTVVTNETPNIVTNTVDTVVTNAGVVTTNISVTVSTNIVTTVSTNREATRVVIRGIKGRTNDLDATSVFRFETVTNAPITKTGRWDTKTGADLGSDRFELARIVILNGTNTPLLSIRGYKSVELNSETVKINHKPVTGLDRSWTLGSANGVAEGSEGPVSVSGDASARSIGVVQ